MILILGFHRVLIIIVLSYQIILGQRHRGLWWEVQWYAQKWCMFTADMCLRRWEAPVSENTGVQWPSLSGGGEERASAGMTMSIIWIQWCPDIPIFGEYLTTATRFSLKFTPFFIIPFSTRNIQVHGPAMGQTSELDLLHTSVNAECRLNSEWSPIIHFHICASSINVAEIESICFNLPTTL